MSAPTAAAVKWKIGANGVATNDSDPTIGAITTTEITPGAASSIIAPGETDVIGGTNRTHYGGAYVSLEEGAGGSLQSAYLWLADGALAIPAQGQIVITDPTGANDGLELVVTGLVDGEPVQEELTLSTSVSTDALFDTASRWWVQTKNEAAIGGVNNVDDLSITVGVTLVGLMRAPDASRWPTGCKTVGSIYRLAVANTANETVSGTNRLTLPTVTGGLATFSSGAWIAGSDQRQALGAIADADYFGFVLEKTLPKGMPAPDGGMPHTLCLTGLAAS